MFCPNCGAKNADESSFCGNCGSKLAAQPDIAEQAPAAPVEPTPAEPAPVEPAFAELPVEEPAAEAAPAAPAYRPPVQPAYQAPVQPAYQPPVQQPAYQQSTYQQPTYQQPAYRQPGYGAPVYQNPVQTNPYGAPAQTSVPGKGMGIASMVLGILSFVLCCLGLSGPLSVVGIILGCIGQSQSKKAGASNGPAIAGIICSAISLALLVIFVVLYIFGLGTLDYTYDYNDFSGYMYHF